MNPRKRRAIARAIIAGIPKSKLNSENIRKFLAKEKEKGRLDLDENSIQEILFPAGFVNKPTSSLNYEDDHSVIVETVEVTIDVIEEEAETAVTVDATEELHDDVDIETEISEDVQASLKSSKTDLQTILDNMGIEYKKNFSKSKLLKLINDN